MTPTIAGLTERQKNIADLLWSCATEEGLILLVKSLPTAQDRVDASSLIKLMIHETQEAEGHLDYYEYQAIEAIDRARGR